MFEEIDWTKHASKLETRPIKTVVLDAVAVLKMIQHSYDDSNGQGLLLGIDVESKLKVSNVLQTGKDVKKEQIDEMIEYLDVLNYDSNIIGWYQSTYITSYWSPKLIEQQYNHQKESSQAVVIIVDTSRRNTLVYKRCC
jgi:translation initiation factor 3 subunit H